MEGFRAKDLLHDTELLFAFAALTRARTNRRLPAAAAKAEEKFVSRRFFNLENLSSNESDCARLITQKPRRSIKGCVSDQAKSDTSKLKQILTTEKENFNLPPAV
jgi:hypothetical protein